MRYKKTALTRRVRGSFAQEWGALRARQIGKRPAGGPLAAPLPVHGAFGADEKMGGGFTCDIAAVNSCPALDVVECAAIVVI